MMTFKPTREQISSGVEALRRSGVVKDDNSFANPFLSYCSSFGATVSQCGLPVALSIYENPDTRAKNRERLPIAIKEYLGGDTTLSKRYVDTPEERQQLSDEILSAVVVLKVALRMFEPVERFEWPQCDVAYSPIKTLQEMLGTLNGDYNIGYQFNHYGERDLNLSDRIDEARNVNVEIYKKLKKCGFEVVGMIVRNPGLIIGGGLPHGEIGDKSYKTGLQFDYTIGLPIIPGSSVKGTIKSAFPKGVDDIARMEYVKDVIRAVIGRKLSDEEVIGLRDNMFGSTAVDDESRKGCDIFADAVLSSTMLKKDSVPVFVEDFLTPHHLDDNPFAEPVPIRIVKVGVGVGFTFCYKFTEWNDITARHKLEICTNIIEDMGLGAKTNVGYGYLTRRK